MIVDSSGTAKTAKARIDGETLVVDTTGVALPFANVLRDRFLELIANGEAEKDWSAISQLAFRHAGLS